jgi:hypothetical protein
MLQVTSPTSLAKIRYQAKKRGFRVLRDGCGCFSLINTRVEPPRPLIGVDHVPLWVIEQVIFTPLPEPSPRRKRMARLSEPTPIVEEAPAPATSSPERSFHQLIRLLREQGGAP